MFFIDHQLNSMIALLSMKSIRKKQKRQRLPEEERREQILKAAYEIRCKDGLEAVTARNVAQTAGLSQGLVFFHFKTTDQLLDALVSYAIEISVGTVAQPEDYAQVPGDEQLVTFLTDRLINFDQHKGRDTVQLLVEAWVLGQRKPRTRQSVREAAIRYRARFLPMARAAIAAEPDRFDGVTPEALSAMALSIVLGTAIQATIDPELFEDDTLCGALRGLLQGD